MGILDDIKGKAEDMMNNEHADKIKQFAEEKGISLDQAKEHFNKKDGQ